MTTAKLVEYQVTRNVLRRREHGSRPRMSRFAGRIIRVAAITAGMLLLGSYLQELLWVMLAAGAVLTLGTRTH